MVNFSYKKLAQSTMNWARIEKNRPPFFVMTTNAFDD
jgi:hypothetical protein